IHPIPSAGEVDGFPILVWYHGGGGIAGNLDIDDFRLRIISVDLRLSIVNVEYRYALSYALLLQKRFIVGGASAGANYSAAVAHRASDDPFFLEHKLTGHVLQIPPLLHPAASPAQYESELLSMEQNKDAPIMSRLFQTRLIRIDPECLQVQPTDAEYSPLLLSHENLAPAYIQVA
ncbi:Alpha/Beta hydrolase protein, partial [Mycena crocata]